MNKRYFAMVVLAGWRFPAVASVPGRIEVTSPLDEGMGYLDDYPTIDAIAAYVVALIVRMDQDTWIGPTAAACREAFREMKRT